MPDYEPLDISGYCNAGLEILKGAQGVPTGAQRFHGLPFIIGGKDVSTGGRCFVAFGDASGPLTLPIGQKARDVIVAHRLLDSKLPEGGPMGRVVADYVFHLSGRREARVPIRERFEIADVLGFGLAPFRAVRDLEYPLPPRREGPWSEMGRRQTEVWPISPVYYLWAWKNPHPDVTIESLEIVPKGSRFFVAGLTLGHADEHPFVREGRRPARVTLKDPAEAAKPFDLEVDVDRGVATYLHPLPEAPAAAFLSNARKGFGEPQNTKSSPAYVEVAAIPSATLTVRRGAEEVGEVRWGDVESKGAAETPRLRVQLLDSGKNWVHVTVLDDATGRPVPCRVHFRSPEGVPYQPHGHHNQVNSNLGTWHIDVGGDVRLGQITYAYIDGTCQGWLPRGDVIVDVARGYEYEPLRAKVRIEPGQRELTLRLKRWTDMNARGWYSGDSHVHFLSPQGAHLESQGEDLNIVNLLQSQWGSLFTNTEDFTGGPSLAQGGRNVVYVSQENRQHILGHMILWALKRPVMPWCSGGPTEAEQGATLETPMSWWADQAHEQGGSVILPHFPNPNGEPATLIATGRIDAVEMIRFERYNHLEYYRYLNTGYRLPLVGGTDKMSSEVPVGLQRTYAHIRDEEFSYDAWRRAVKAGRTFMTSGPVIHLSVDGHEAGDTIELRGPGTVEVEAWAESVLPVNTLQVVMGGRVVAEATQPKGSRRLSLREKVKVERHTWLAARCGGPSYFDGLPHLDVWNRGVFAHTSPVYVAVGGTWWMFDRQGAEYMLTMVQGGLEFIRESSAQLPAGTTHHHGEADHMAFLERPFLEAQRLLEERLRQGR